MLYMLAYAGEAGRQEAFLLLALESDSLKCLSATSAWFRHLVHNFLSSVIVDIDPFGETTYDMILLSKCRFRSLQNLDLRIPMGYNMVFCKTIADFPCPPRAHVGNCGG